MLAGAGLLWMGWTGFNGGAPYTASTDASLAILNTHVCTATSLLTWLVLDIAVSGKPSVVGAVNGMITGLVCITPGAGTFSFCALTGYKFRHARLTSRFSTYRSCSELGGHPDGLNFRKCSMVHNDNPSQEGQAIKACR